MAEKEDHSWAGQAPTAYRTHRVKGVDSEIKREKYGEQITVSMLPRFTSSLMLKQNLTFYKIDFLWPMFIMSRTFSLFYKSPILQRSLVTRFY